MSKKLRVMRNSHIAHWCPACRNAHAVLIDPRGAIGWSFNDDHERPTFDPSVKVHYNGPDAGEDGAPPETCHYFLQAGMLTYCADSTHALAGQIVELPDFPDDFATD